MYFQLNKAGSSNGTQADDKSAENGTNEEQTKVPDDIFDFYEKMDMEDEDDLELKTVSFEINQDKLETLQQT